MRIDHVLYGVGDLDAAADALLDATGLVAGGGGTHPGLGTANRIVPVGDDYIELITVVDPTAPNPFAAMLADAVERGGDGLVGVSLEVPDIDAVAARVGASVVDAERAVADGPRLRFRVAGMEYAVAERLPFFIQWDEGRERRAGQPVRHQGVTPTGIAWVEVGGDPVRLGDYLGGDVPGLRPVGGEPGVRAAAIAVADGTEIVLGR